MVKQNGKLWIRTRLVWRAKGLEKLIPGIYLIMFSTIKLCCPYRDANGSEVDRYFDVNILFLVHKRMKTTPCAIAWVGRSWELIPKQEHSAWEHATTFTLELMQGEQFWTQPIRQGMKRRQRRKQSTYMTIHCTWLFWRTLNQRKTEEGKLGVGKKKSRVCWSWDQLPGGFRGRPSNATK
jgi:hypothetical protein